MRTHLDEIVEQELSNAERKGGENCDVFGLRIAARAFRHGCEMGGLAAVRLCEEIRTEKAASFGSYEVQPAPAKEEECHRTVRSAKEAAAYVEAGLCPRCASRHPDRRKRQRRSGCERVHGGIYTRRLHHDGVEWMTWADERRSGKERRSKLKP